jgi:hypothetical protein
MTLHAGVASVPLTAPIGADMVGYLRRWQPVRGYGEPLEISALALDDGERRALLVAFDGLGTPGEYGRRIRSAAAAAAGCAPEAVLVNASHTHAAPPPPGMLKIGGTTFDLREDEARYAESLVDLAASAAAVAAHRVEPATLAYGRDTAEGSVNRRQRVPGGTILGWNPDAACDREVAVLRIDRGDTTAIATVVVFACHPVVVGWDVAETSSDFVGPLRARVRVWTGGDCLFLQGCAGNVLPLEAFFERPGPERAFGERLALAALTACQRAEVVATELRQQPTASAVPIAIWRRRPTGAAGNFRVAAMEARVALPFLEVPSAEEARGIGRELGERLDALRLEKAGREAWNPVAIHQEWARRVESGLAAGTIEPARETVVQALRFGPVGIVAWPCEPFCELGLELKERAPAPFPVALGYSNDLVGYVPTPEEYPHGGYEPSVSQRHFGNPSPFAPEASRMLVDCGLQLLGELFPQAPGP